MASRASNLFEEWMRELDAKFAREGRKVGLIVDNCPAHPHVGGLQAIGHCSARVTKIEEDMLWLKIAMQEIAYCSFFIISYK